MTLSQMLNLPGKSQGQGYLWESPFMSLSFSFLAYKIGALQKFWAWYDKMLESS